MDIIYIIVFWLFVWFVIGMLIEAFITIILGIKPKEKLGKGILYFINLPFNVFIFLITSVATIISLIIITPILMIMNQFKRNT